MIGLAKDVEDSQKDRIRDAPILLQKRILRNIIQNHSNKTYIETTHRFSVLNMCQRVYRVMETHVTELTEEESSKMAIDSKMLSAIRCLIALFWNRINMILNKIKISKCDKYISNLTMYPKNCIEMK